MEEKDSHQINRRKFLKVCGSAALGAGIAGIAGKKVWDMVAHPDKVFFDAKSTGSSATTGQKALASPFRRVFAFETAQKISALEVTPEAEIILGVEKELLFYGMDGVMHHRLAVSDIIRDLAVHRQSIYVLHPAGITVFGLGGERLAHWQACSELADYCSLTVLDQGVFVTDACAKNICHYRLDGSLVRFIGSPAGFVVPSYSFGITHLEDHIFCSNPGRHCIEEYDIEGNYVGSFGKRGLEAGHFCGCCNPVHLVATPTGELLTSEKGIPRISCYHRDGSFRSILLDQQALGGGHEAYDLRRHDGRLIVAGEQKVSVFQYDYNQDLLSLCGSCTLNCPLKTV